MASRARILDLCEILFEPDDSPLPSPMGSGLILDTFHQLGDSREAGRVIRSAKKGSQLPDSEPGLLLVRARSLWWHPDVPRDLGRIGERFRLEMATRPTISAAIVYETRIEGVPDAASFSETPEYHAFSTRGLRSRDVVFIPNPGARWRLGKPEVELLVGPNMIW
jgi:hypothetical protein